MNGAFVKVGKRVAINLRYKVNAIVDGEQKVVTKNIKMFLDSYRLWNIPELTLFNKQNNAFKEIFIKSLLDNYNNYLLLNKDEALNEDGKNALTRTNFKNTFMNLIEKVLDELKEKEKKENSEKSENKEQTRENLKLVLKEFYEYVNINNNKMENKCKRHLQK